jgi:hypothetical protein
VKGRGEDEAGLSPPLLFSFGISPALQTQLILPPQHPIQSRPPHAPFKTATHLLLPLSLRSRTGEAAQEQHRRRRCPRQGEAHAEERAPGVPHAAQLCLPRRHAVRAAGKSIRPASVVITRLIAGTGGRGASRRTCGTRTAGARPRTRRASKVSHSAAAPGPRPGSCCYSMPDGTVSSHV